MLINVKPLITVVVVGVFASFGQGAIPEIPDLGRGSQQDNSRIGRQVDSIFEASQFPWYDADRGEPSFPKLKDGAASGSADREQIRKKPPPRNPNNNSATPAVAPAPAPPGGSGNMGFSTLIWITVIAVLAMLVGLFVWVSYWRGSTSPQLDSALQTRLSSQSRVEQLPIELEPGSSDFRELARAASMVGDMRRAMMFLFSHTLLLLDKHHFVQLRRGKTNRQYLSEVLSPKSIALCFEQIILSFEKSFFGNCAVDLTEFERCWTSAEEIERAIANDGGK